MDPKRAQSLDFFIFAGEKSGDLLGADLLDNLFKQRADLKIAAVAGPKMRDYPIDVIMPMENFEVMGFIDVACHFLRLYRQFHAIKRRILELNPKQVVLIDYPGFNLAMARHLRRSGFKGRLIQYVCPTIWAWKKKRLNKMVDTLDLVMTLFPFEPACFEKTSLEARYVGHPLIEKIPPPVERTGRFLALFPGSRLHEIERNLPLQLKVARQMRREIAISVASPKARNLIERLIGKEGEIQLFDNSYELMRQSAFAIAKSGTVNLELALFEVPTVVTYAISPLDLFIARKLFKIDLPHYSLPNILAEREIFPELYGPRFTEENLFNALSSVIEKKEAVISGCRLVRERFGHQMAAQRASSLLLR